MFGSLIGSLFEFDQFSIEQQLKHRASFLGERNTIEWISRRFSRRLWATLDQSEGRIRMARNAGGRHGPFMG